MTQPMEKIIKEITEKIVKEYKPEKIILFGSYAWGTPHEWSDVDLFMIKRSLKRRIDRAREVRKILFGNKFPPMDLLIYTPEELVVRTKLGDPFIRDIVARGRQLYAR